MTDYTSDTLRTLAQEQFSRELLTIEDVHRLDACATAWDDDITENHLKDERIAAYHKANLALEAEVAEWEASFELYHAAEMRGIKLWQEATGQDKVWPDAGKLSAWLLAQLDDREAEVAELRGAALDYLNGTIEGNATLGQQKRLARAVGLLPPAGKEE